MQVVGVELRRRVFVVGSILIEEVIDVVLHPVDVDTSLGNVLAVCPGKYVRALDAAFVGQRAPLQNGICADVEAERIIVKSDADVRWEAELIVGQRNFITGWVRRAFVFEIASVLEADLVSPWWH